MALKQWTDDEHLDWTIVCVKNRQYVGGVREKIVAKLVCLWKKVELFFF
jgi:hypothetical protein